MIADTAQKTEQYGTVTAEEMQIYRHLTGEYGKSRPLRDEVIDVVAGAAATSAAAGMLAEDGECIYCGKNRIVPNLIVAYCCRDCVGTVKRLFFALAGR